MLNELKVRKNENLIRNILKYNNVKDLALTCQVNKTFFRASGKFQSYWREKMNETFSSNYEHYNLCEAQNLSEESYNNDNINWKDIMKKGFKIRNNWKKLFKINDKNCKNYEVFLCDIEKIENEIYTSLKEFIGFPSLRKSNLFVENDLNSTLQIYLLDNIFDSQDLYDYYDEYFIKDNDLPVRNTDLPFSGLIENYSVIYKDFTPLNEKILSNLRWYNYEEILHINESNDLTSVLINIVKTIQNFCEFSCFYIKKFSSNNLLFLNEYSKRYRHFIDVAIHLNNYLENLNVLVNYFYEQIFQIKYNPKFSILRLMLKIWNREVLQSIHKEEGMISKMVELFDDYLNKEIIELSDKKDNLEEEFQRKPNKVALSIIEQLTQHLLDYSCNEFNSFYLNSTQIVIEEGLYKIWEKEIIKIFHKKLETIVKLPSEIIMNFLFNSQTLNAFIPRTRSKIFDIISSFYINNKKIEVIHEFKSFVEKLGNVNISEAEGHFRIFGDLVEEREEKLLDLLMNTMILDNKIIAKYKAITFIKQSKKNNLTLILDYISFTEKIRELQRERVLTDNIILKENEQRKINITQSKITEKLYSLNKEFRVDEVIKAKESVMCFSEDYKGYNLELDIYFKNLLSEECLITYRTK